MVYSLCKEHQIECVSWNDPPLLGTHYNNNKHHTNDDSSNTSTSDISTYQQYQVSHFRSFISFVEGSMRYKEMDSNSIRETCRRLVVIDLLPTSLLLTSREGMTDDRMRSDM